jgi:predicted amidohydrolase
MTREILIAAVQLPVKRSGESPAEIQETNFRLAEEWLDRAGRQNAAIACLGECFNVTGLELKAENLAGELEGAVEAVLDRLGQIARRCQMAVIAPAYCLLEGRPRNAALVLDRNGELTGAYCKVHPTRSEQELGIVPGDDWPVFNLDFGAIGVQICHDNSFPESARCLALNGAEIIFCPHLMSGWGDEFMAVLMRSPAIHNGVFHVPVSYGQEPGLAWRPGMMIGRSSVIGPDGTVLADAGRYPGIALATVDLDRPRIAHDFTRAGDHPWREDMLADRRPDTYTPVSRPRQAVEAPVLPENGARAT